LAVESQVGSKPPRWSGNIPDTGLQHLGVGIVAILLSWLFFSDVTNLRLDSHDIETFRDHAAIGGDIAATIFVGSWKTASDSYDWPLIVLRKRWM